MVNFFMEVFHMNGGLKISSKSKASEVFELSRYENIYSLGGCRMSNLLVRRRISPRLPRPVLSYFVFERGQ